MTTLKTYLELVRLPNVFTAVADVMMGFLIVHGTLEPRLMLALLVAGSCLLYLAGMILNDVFDVEQDARERPERPIPSGRVDPGGALRLGLLGLLGGPACAWLVSAIVGDLRAGLIATALAALIVLYDRILKRTPLGPLAMGGCRFFNVLLGMSATTVAWNELNGTIAAGVGVYIVGVTWFARTEARPSSRAQLAVATLVAAAGVALLVSFPYRFAGLIDRQYDGLKVAPVVGWYLLWALLSVSMFGRMLRAVGRPEPAMVQAAVKNCIVSLVAIDAACLYALRGAPPALFVLVLIFPTVWLGRWLYST